MNLALILRQETKKDFQEVEYLTYQAFKGSRDVCDEHFLVHKLRQSKAYLPAFSLVAEIEGKLVGYVMFTKAKVVDETGKEALVLALGPVSIKPTFQKIGIGTTLITYAITQIKRLAYSGIILFGHPEYYPRFGFVTADQFGITTASGENFDAFMALELQKGSLQEINGKFFNDPAFEIDPVEFEQFNQRFLKNLNNLN